MKRVGGVPTVFPAEGGHVALEENLLKVVYDHGPIQVHKRVIRSLCLSCDRIIFKVSPASA